MLQCGENQLFLWYILKVTSFYYLLGNSAAFISELCGKIEYLGHSITSNFIVFIGIEDCLLTYIDQQLNSHLFHHEAF